MDGMRNFVLQAAKVDANPASALGKVKGGVISAIPKATDVLKYMMTTDGGRRLLYMAAGMKLGTPGD
jgi:hypothetical protein